MATTSVAGMHLSAQTTSTEVEFWIGSGSDTTLFYIDFHQDIGAGTPSCYVWGYLHEPGATGMDMLMAIDVADENLSLEVTESGFLNNLWYGPYAGIGGTDGFYWATWSGPNLPNLEMNMGLTTELGANDAFGCSFTDYNPAVPPFNAGAAYDPASFTAADVEFWAGEGTQSCVVVIDFEAATGVATSYAWGYRFSSMTDISTVLTQLAAADEMLDLALDEQVLSVSYNGLSATAGENGQWAVWTGTNLGNWQLAAGLGETVLDNDFVGISFAAADTTIRPGYPQAATGITSVENVRNLNQFELFPNPASERIFVKRPEAISTIIVLSDLRGSVIKTTPAQGNTVEIDIADLAPGVYFITIDGLRQRFVRQ